MKNLIPLTLLLSLSVTLTNSAPSPVEVEIKQGKLLGSLGQSRGGREYHTFKGIPYGKIERRFDPSVPADGWTGSHNATGFGTICGQFGTYFFPSKVPIGEESDCLSVNVWTPSINNKEKLLPVVAYIHGGAFQFGSSSMAVGDYFMDQDVVFVSLNYRVGILGFLSTADEVIPGNMGLKDQSLALKWIQENIHSFGGDKNKVLIAGTSAGSASVSYHTISPMSAGLFHSAFATSGSALNPWALAPSPKNSSQQVAKKMGCPLEPSSALAKCLREVDWKELLKIGPELSRWNHGPLSMMGPVIEKTTTPNPFLAEHPAALMETGKFNRVPIVYGVMEDEGILIDAFGIMADPVLKKELNEDWLRVAPIAFYYDEVLSKRQDKMNETSNELRNFYFGDKPVNEDTFKNLADVCSDRMFNHGVRKAAILQSRHTPVYTFIQTYKGEKKGLIQAFFGDQYKGPPATTHGDDAMFLFPFEMPGIITSTSDMEGRDLQFSKKFLNLLSSTAATTKPESAEPIWTPITQEQALNNRIDWYKLDLGSSKVSDPFRDRMIFWDKLEGKFAKYLNEKEKKVDKKEL